MNWPLKIQGRLLTKIDVNQIRRLLGGNPSWNRSHLSRELSELWSWRRPDGQLKDMACRELLRKLESRSLIKLPPRQRPGPGRAPVIEEVEVDKNPVFCEFSKLQPVRIIDARSSIDYEKAFNYLVKEDHYLRYGGPLDKI